MHRDVVKVTPDLSSRLDRGKRETRTKGYQVQRIKDKVQRPAFVKILTTARQAKVRRKTTPLAGRRETSNEIVYNTLNLFYQIKLFQQFSQQLCRPIILVFGLLFYSPLVHQDKQIRLFLSQYR